MSVKEIFLQKYGKEFSNPGNYKPRLLEMKLGKLHVHYDLSNPRRYPPLFISENLSSLSVTVGFPLSSNLSDISQKILSSLLFY